MGRHLDLGCGLRPRNPYKHQEVWGLDISDEATKISNNIIKCNVAIEAIPFPSDSFDSVSAYDFLEHVPRILCVNGVLINPFLDLMDEVYRVLKPEGRFYAITPAYPHHEAFVDPTHVNIITRKTHRYFTLPSLMAKAYGFNGVFECDRSVWVRMGSDDYIASQQSIVSFLKGIKDGITRKKTHLLWEFTKR